MLYWLAGLLWVVMTAPVHAFDPLHPGMPACEGGESGYWQTVTIQRASGDTITYLAIASVDFLDPATVICWLDGPQMITAGVLPGHVPIKSQPIEHHEPVERSLHGLRQLYAHQR